MAIAPFTAADALQAATELRSVFQVQKAGVIALRKVYV